jgi:hypothetical protein
MVTSHEAPARATDTIWIALARAQGLVRSVDKDATNTFHRYSYASAESVIDEARRVLSQCGLSATQTGLRVIYHPLPEVAFVLDAKGNKRPAPQTGEIRMRLRVSHPDGGSLPIVTGWHWQTENGRPPDKAIAGATTTALAYALRGLLLIPRGLEGEDRPDQRDDRDYRPPQAVWDGRAPQAAPAPAPTPRASRDGRAPTPDAERVALRQRYGEAVQVLGREQALEIGGPIDGSTPTEQIRAIVTTLEAAARDVAGG